MDFLQKLDFMMERYSLNKNTLSQNSGIPYTTIDGWYKKGYEGLKLSTLRKLSNYFNTFIDFWVLDDVTDPNYGKANSFQVEFEEAEHIKKYRILDKHGKEIVDSVLNIEHRRCVESAAKKMKAIRKPFAEAAEELEDEVREVIKLRFSELKASAGTGYQLDDDQTTTWKVLYNEYTRMADFCLEVDGQSMEPKIFDGDIILIRQQPAVDVGEIGLFTVDDTGYVKQQGKDRLISINPNYDDIFPNEYANVICRGKVIGVLDPDWIVEQ